MTAIAVTRPEDFDAEFDIYTTISYRWRDADNGKNDGEITFEGVITDEQAQAILDACTLLDGEYLFRTDDVDFEHLAHEQGYEVRSHDPKTHILTGFEVTNYAPYVDPRTIEEVVAQFQAATTSQKRRNAARARRLAAVDLRAATTTDEREQMRFIDSGDTEQRELVSKNPNLTVAAIERIVERWTFNPEFVDAFAALPNMTDELRARIRTW